MSAPKGNRFWEARSSHGRNPKFESSEQLWEACQEYFKWVEDNPLWSSKTTQFQGEPIDLPEAKMRAMTMDGLCLFLDVTDQTLHNYKLRGDDFLEVITRVEKIIRYQKFTGAAADLLNPNIIARDLGLADKKETKTTLSIEDMPDSELEARIHALEAQLGK
jgi:hypothetical protein